MKREHDLQARLQSLSTLREAVSAMKSLAAHHLREARAGLPAMHSYRDGVERIARNVGVSIPAGDGPVGLLVMGAELGLCGAYNVRVADAAAAHREQLGPGPTFVLGRRAATAMTRRGITLANIYRGPTVADGITEILVTVLEGLLPAYVAQRLSALDVVSTPFEGVGVHRPVVARLLPLHWPPIPDAAAIPYSDREAVSRAAGHELLYVMLYGRLLDSLASEHGARLTATQSAEQWLTRRTELLRRRLASARREASTQEVIEIAAGVRARDRSRPLDRPLRSRTWPSAKP